MSGSDPGLVKTDVGVAFGEGPFVAHAKDEGAGLPRGTDRQRGSSALEGHGPSGRIDDRGHGQLVVQGKPDRFGAGARRGQLEPRLTLQPA